jgi:hypothetical protein
MDDDALFIQHIFQQYRILSTVCKINSNNKSSKLIRTVKIYQWFQESHQDDLQDFKWTRLDASDLGCMLHELLSSRHCQHELGRLRNTPIGDRRRRCKRCVAFLNWHRMQAYMHDVVFSRRWFRTYLMLYLGPCWGHTNPRSHLLDNNAVGVTGLPEDPVTIADLHLM